MAPQLWRLWWFAKLWTTEEACYWQIFFLKFEFELFVTGKVCYHHNSWVTGVYIVYLLDRNSGEKTSQIERLYDSNWRLYGTLASPGPQLQRQLAYKSCLGTCGWDYHLVPKIGTYIQILDTALAVDICPTFLNIETTNETFQQPGNTTPSDIYWRGQLVGMKAQADNSS